MYSEIAANKRRTVIAMLIFVLFVGAIGVLFSKIYHNPSIIVATLIGSATYAFISYFTADKMAVAANGAKLVTVKEEPRLYRVVENISITNGMPTPKVYVMEDPGLNAFATGRDPKHALVCVTRGLLDTMTDAELQGVIAHEMGHIKNYDIRVMMIALGLAGVVAFLCDIFLRMSFWGFGSSDDNESDSNNGLFMILGIVAAILAPIIATVIQLSISRKREYLADATSALTTRNPEALASALHKIKDYGATLQKQNTASAHLFFANPLKGATLAGLFSTHPPIDERIARLKEMGRKL